MSLPIARGLFSLLDSFADLILSWDRELLERISSSPSLRRLDALFLLATYLGDGYIWGLLGLWLVLFGDPLDHRNVLVGLGVGVVQLTLVRGLKLLFGRARPSLLRPTRKALLLDIHAFPSGHATLAFGIAYLVARLYPWPLPLLTYGIAALIALSRVYLREHYPLDVAGGVALGTMTAHSLLPLFLNLIQWG